MGMIDIAIAGLIFLSAIIGIFRGFIREVLSLVAWIAAFYIAFKFHGDLASKLTAIEIESIRNGAAFLGIFFIVLLVFSLFNYVVAKLVDSTGLSGTDRFLGVIFGIVRGAAIVLVLIVLASLTPFPESKAWQKSMLIPHFVDTGQWLKVYLPEEFAKYLDLPSEPAQSSPEDESVSPETNKQIGGE